MYEAAIDLTDQATELDANSIDNGGLRWSEARQRLFDFCAGRDQTAIVFDTDATYYDSLTGAVRPGFSDLVHELKQNPDKYGDVKILGWSLMGSGQVEKAATAAGVKDDFDGAFQKPTQIDNLLEDVPFSQAEATETLGLVPDITVDDLANDAIEGVPQIHVRQFFPPRTLDRALEIKPASELLITT